MILHRLNKWFWDLPEWVVYGLILLCLGVAGCLIGLGLYRAILWWNSSEGHFQIRTPQGVGQAVRVEPHANHLVYWTRDGTRVEVHGSYQIEGSGE